MGGGGSDLPSKSNSKLFGGGSGAGVTVTPIAFLTIKDGKVDLMPLITQPGPVDSLITKLPGAIDQLTTDFARRREEKAAKEAEAKKAGITRYDIVALDDGKTYVKASRNIITSDTLEG